MKKRNEFLFRLRALFRRGRLDAEMGEQMQQHLETAAAKESATACRHEATHFSFAAAAGFPRSG